MEIQAISSTAATLAQSQSTSAGASASKASQSAPPKAGGTPPAKPPAAASESSSSSSSSSTDKIYDKRDADQDGIVSYQEQLLYSLKHPTDETESEATVSASQTQAGLSAYKQAQKAGSQSE